ncbi:B-cell receptor CD22 [Anabarilius grahami]|uniref:B-cell receptor CD22 n=1 Tax=Anabarilius grahami TaxID=495550 RepID=A0A3N0Z0C9_ANAGA|nr:B-cell receptor CD22 [Anabarilius grahami]
MATFTLSVLGMTTAFTYRWVDGLQDWGVNYSPSYVCALKGSKVKISCTLKYPQSYKFETVTWTKTAVTVGESPDVCSDPEKRGRVQCHSEDKDTHSITLTNVTEADKHVYYCRITNNQNKMWTVIPGAWLDVTGVYGLLDWGVNYSPSYVCALKGSTVKISCTLTYPDYDKLIKAFWTKTVGESPDVCSDPEKRGRVQCHSEDKDTHSITLTNVTEADKHVYYCRIIDDHNKMWTVIPGAWLDVTDLQVETQQRVKEGDSVTLTCKSSCSLTEQTTFIWYRNTQRVTEGIVKENQLHLQSVSRSDKGNYQCEIRGNNDHLISPAVYLDVEYPPKSVSVSISPSGEIVSGDSVTLNCSSDSNPPAEISWNKGETFLGSGDTYNISNIKSEASGNYYCSARNEHGSQSSAAVTVNVMCESVFDFDQFWMIICTVVCIAACHFTIFVFTDPPKSVSVSISPSEIVSGDSVTLNCSSDSNPTAEISWFKGKTLVRSGRIFSISNISSDHSGEYKCRFRNKHGEKDSDTVMLNVMYPPKSVSVSISPSGEIVSGDSVTLNCSSDSNPPALNFSWFKEDETSAVGSGQRFSISSFNSSFSGRFYCEAQNKYGSQRSASVSLTVKALQVQAPQQVLEKETVNLTCRTACDLTDSFIWYKNGQALNFYRDILQLQSVPSDSGSYSCAVRGQEHLPSPAVSLSVMYSPRNTSVSISPSGEIVSGDSVTLNCSSDSNPPALNFSWFKEDETSSVGSGQSFSISSFNSSFSGRFYCEAQNKYGSQRSASVSLTVKGRAAHTCITLSEVKQINLFGCFIYNVFFSSSVVGRLGILYISIGVICGAVVIIMLLLIW